MGHLVAYFNDRNIGSEPFCGINPQAGRRGPGFISSCVADHMRILPNWQT